MLHGLHIYPSGRLFFNLSNVPYPPQQFGKEILADEVNDVKYEKVLKILEAASGAAYGTGK